MRSLTEGRTAIAFINLGAMSADVAIDLTHLGLARRHRVGDAWRGITIGEASGLESRLAPHGSPLFVLTPEDEGR